MLHWQVCRCNDLYFPSGIETDQLCNGTGQDTEVAMIFTSHLGLKHFGELRPTKAAVSCNDLYFPSGIETTYSPRHGE